MGVRLMVRADGAAEPAIVKTELLLPRGTKRRYVLRGTSASPGGTEKVIQATYTHVSVDILREHEMVDRKKMTNICAKNNMSYKRAMAYFAPGERQEQLQRAREQKQQQRKRQRRQLTADLAAVAAAVGL